MMLRNVLIVDDSPVFLTLLGKFLTKHGYILATAESGFTALEIVKIFTPDVIFVDLVMPGMDGKKLCQKFREIPRLKDTTIALISATEMEQGMKLADAGFDNFFEKESFDQTSIKIKSFLDKLASQKSTL